MDVSPIVAETEATQDFLKAVYTLQQHQEWVSTNALAEQLSIAPSSITAMAQRMAGSGWIEYRRYHGLRLTPAGESVALRIVRRHRLLEMYLVRALGFSPDDVHDEADRIEHAASEKLIAQIEEVLGYPKVCPHGQPIPSC